jgi:carbamoyl-phosphate synthase small subunit
MGKKALLMLEDGQYGTCESFSGDGEVFGELVFNTALTGYQEIITDPSYKGQIVMMTASMIGNYGIRQYEDESAAVHAEGLVVREYGGMPRDTEGSPSYRPEHAHAYIGTQGTGSSQPLHSPVTENLAGYLFSSGRVGVEGVDTRFFTTYIRESGAMKAGITTRTLDAEKFLQIVQKAPDIVGRDLVREVIPENPYLFSEGEGPRIAVLDCGIKVSSLALLARRGCRVEVFPAYIDRREVLSTHPDGILLSNGPGDPAALRSIVSLVESLIGEVPIFGICLGHQIIGQALGAKTFKLKFGHHGGNHPVRDERTKKVFITSQNHGFAVDVDTLDRRNIEVTFINLNDYTLEGLRHKNIPLFSVQFHPEAGPGPHDTMFLFDEFLRMIHGE